jgi:hypothetical protein
MNKSIHYNRILKEANKCILLSEIKNLINEANILLNGSELLSGLIDILNMKKDNIEEELFLLIIQKSEQCRDLKTLAKIVKEFQILKGTSYYDNFMPVLEMIKIQISGVEQSSEFIKSKY